MSIDFWLPHILTPFSGRSVQHHRRVLLYQGLEQRCHAGLSAALPFAQRSSLIFDAVQLNKSAFDETVAIRVINAFGIFAQDYMYVVFPNVRYGQYFLQARSGLLIALINKHVSARIDVAHEYRTNTSQDVLVSTSSPLSPKGAQIAEQIANLQYELTVCFCPYHLVAQLS